MVRLLPLIRRDSSLLSAKGTPRKQGLEAIFGCQLNTVSIASLTPGSRAYLGSFGENIEIYRGHVLGFRGEARFALV